METFEILGLVLLSAVGIIAAFLGLMIALDEGELDGLFMIIFGVGFCALGILGFTSIDHQDQVRHDKAVRRDLYADGWNFDQIEKIHYDPSTVDLWCGPPSYEIFRFKTKKLDGKYQVVVGRAKSVGGGYTKFKPDQLKKVCS